MVQYLSPAPADWPRWRAARRAALTADPEAFLVDWDDGEETRWHARLLDPEAHRCLALREGRPVGVVRGVEESPGRCAVRSLWVARELRGDGVADRLVAGVEEWARGRAAERLQLAVFPTNARARAFYRRAGFALTGEQGPLLDDGVTCQEIWAKPLR